MGRKACAGSIPAARTNLSFLQGDFKQLQTDRRFQLSQQLVARNEEGPATSSPDRSTIFISHANPEDDAFSIWLATQLAIAGYAVWCDKTNLLGGEKFWSDIEEGIDAHAFRVLFVSTLASNTKPGTLRELRLAFEAQEKHGLKDFVVPLKIDQLPFASMQKEVRDLNCIRFEENWAAGLSQLLKLLEREGTPKSARSGPTAVAEWHRRSLDRRREIVVEDETCHSNWFQFRLPQKLYLHRYPGPPTALPSLVEQLAWPHHIHGSYVATFASKKDVEAAMPSGSVLAETVSIKTALFVEKGDDKLQIERDPAFNIVGDLVRQAWETALDQRGLASFELASGLRARFFRDGQLEKNRAYFKTPSNRRAYRQVVGRKTKRTLEGEKKPDGFWHYAVSASPQLLPFSRIVLRHHVIFTDDGEKPWDKPDRMHNARRSVCKNWWNPEWRDRLFAFTAELAQGRTEFLVPVGSRLSIKVIAAPMNFISPWTYFEGKDDGLDEGTEIELIEDDEDGRDDDE